MTEDELADALIIARAIKSGTELRMSAQKQCRVLAEAVLHFMEPKAPSPKIIKLSAPESDMAKARGAE